jgi:hypothetical protein
MLVATQRDGGFFWAIFAEQVSWCGIDPLKSVLSGWPDGLMAGRVIQAVSVPVQNDPAA